MQKTLILAVETSGKIGSVAIALGKKILGQATFSGSMRHSSELFPAIRSLLDSFSRKPKDIKHIYISAGPGSFTGLRIAVALAKTMYLTNAAKLVAVDSLDVIAANAADYIKEKNARIEKIATILDAKRSQFFIAAYKLSCSDNNNTQYEIRNTKYEKILPECLMTPSQFLENFAHKNKPVWLLGEGLLYYKDAFKTEGVYSLPENYWSPRAAKVHQLGWQKAAIGQFADPLTLQPFYLRRPEAEEKWQQRKLKTKH